MNNSNKSGYSVIIALFMVGFLLVLTTGILNLVLRELKDNRGRESYLKAYYGAEAGQELALLKIKENGYGYYDKINHSKNNKSIILSKNPSSLSNFNGNEDVFISYDLNTKTSSYSGVLSPLGYDIIPLFYLTGSSSSIISKKVTDLELVLSSGNPNDLSWNIVSDTSGISGNGTFDKNTKGKGRSASFSFIEEEIGNFLSLDSNIDNYIILFNSNSSSNSDIKYSISSSKEFTKPKSTILSSAQIGSYKQNLETELDNTEYLNILRYSIYSK